MGTKTQPAKFDCYKNAEDEEPMFVLLARDVTAPLLVALWAILRKRYRETEQDREQEIEAMVAARAMRDWLQQNRPHKVGIYEELLALLDSNDIDIGDAIVDAMGILEA